EPQATTIIIGMIAGKNHAVNARAISPDSRKRVLDPARRILVPSYDRTSRRRLRRCAKASRVHIRLENGQLQWTERIHLERIVRPPERGSRICRKGDGYWPSALGTRNRRGPWRSPGGYPPRLADRRYHGSWSQEPPRTTRRLQSPAIHAEPSVGAPLYV